MRWLLLATLLLVAGAAGATPYYYGGSDNHEVWNPIHISYSPNVSSILYTDAQRRGQPFAFDGAYKMDFDGAGCLDGDTGDVCVSAGPNIDADCGTSPCPLEGTLSGSWNSIGTVQDVGFTFDTPDVSGDGSVITLDFIAVKLADNGSSADDRNFTLGISGAATDFACTLDMRPSIDRFRVGTNNGADFSSFSSSAATGVWADDEVLKFRLQLELNSTTGDTCTAWWTQDGDGDYGETGTTGETLTVTDSTPSATTFTEVRLGDFALRETSIVIDDVRVCEYDPGAGNQCGFGAALTAGIWDTSEWGNALWEP